METIEGGAAAAEAQATPAELRGLRRLLLVGGALLYLAYALLTPPFQTPDEHQHLFRAWQLAHFQLHGDRRGDEAGGLLPAGLPRAATAELGSIAPHASRPVPKRPLGAIVARRTPLSDAQPKSFVNFQGGVLYSPAGYVPQIVAVWTGETLGLPVETIVRLGRLLNAALTLGLFALALSLIPVGRRFVLLLALMPMTASLAASLGQDGLTIAGCTLITALGIRARIESRWTPGTLILLGLLAAVVGLSKIVYLPLVGIALLPLPRGVRRLSWIACPAALALAGAVLSVWWLHANSGVVVRMASDIATPGAQLGFIASHPLGLPLTLARTLALRSIPVFLSTFTFGWLTVGPVLGAALLSLVAFWLALRQGGEQPEALGHWWRRWAALIVVVVATGIALAMYLAASPLGAPVVEGLQGRYFLPLLPLACLAIMRRSPARGDVRLPILLMIGANIAALAAIGGAFYTI